MSTATFDPSNATVVVNSAQGVATWRPPFTTQAQITSYADGLQNVSALRKKGMLTLVGPLTPTTNLASISTDLPAVQIYNIPNNDPPIFAVVYTDINGNSSFSYKNDPNNVIQLVQNGSKIPPTPGNSGTFDPSTATVVVNSAQGVSTMRPPFTTPDQISNYMTGLQSVSALKSAQIIHITALFPDSAVNLISTDLPAVRVYNIDEYRPTHTPIFAVVYTDINGNSSFSYKNDPNNVIQLVQNGSKIPPTVQVQQSIPSANQTQNYDAGTKSNEGGGILGLICWCLSCMSCIGIVILCVLLVIKQSSVPQPSTQ